MNKAALPLLAAVAVSLPCAARADAGVDAGLEASTPSCTTDDSGACLDAGTPLGCDGALCDTSNESTCAVSPAPASSSPLALGLALATCALAAVRRARKVTR